jgi:formiminoglutamase
MTISGFSVEDLRQFINYFGKSENAAYLHICEGAPDLDEGKNQHLIGKLIGYLVTDFLKANAAVH